MLRAETLEQMIVRYIWQLCEEDEDQDDSKKVHVLPVITEEADNADVEEGFGPENRKTKLTSCIVVSCALGLEIACLGLGWRMLSLQVTVDGNYLRLLIALSTPITLFLSLVGTERMPWALTMLTRGSSSSSWSLPISCSLSARRAA